jgi:hypothetical protein
MINSSYIFFSHSASLTHTFFSIFAIFCCVCYNIYSYTLYCSLILLSPFCSYSLFILPLIWLRTGVEVLKRVRGKYLRKRLHVRIEHVKLSHCKDELFKRIATQRAQRQQNAQLKKEGKPLIGMFPIIPPLTVFLHSFLLAALLSLLSYPFTTWRTSKTNSRARVCFLSRYSYHVYSLTHPIFI